MEHEKKADVAKPAATHKPPAGGTDAPAPPMTTVKGKKSVAEARANIVACLAATKEQLAAFEKVINPALAAPGAGIDSSVGTSQGDAWQVAYGAFTDLNNAMMHRIVPGG
jgi:hypothetical protein